MKVMQEWNHSLTQLMQVWTRSLNTLLNNRLTLTQKLFVL